MKKQRIAIWDNLKFILIFLVVLGHFVEYYTLQSDNMRFVFFYIYIFHMPLFIFISGLFSKRLIKEKDYKKIFEFLILYFIINFYFLLTQIGFHFLFKTPSVNINFLNPSGVPWFMLSTFFFYLMTILLKKIDKKYLFIISIILACFIGYDSSISDFLALSRTIVFYPFFLAGYYIDSNSLLKYVKTKRKQILSLTILLFTSLLCYIFIDKIYFLRPLITGRNPFNILLNFRSIGGLLRLLYYVIVSLFILSIIAITPSKNNIFTKLGSRSLSVYLLHFPIIELFNLASGYKLLDKTSYILLIPIALILTIILSQNYFEKIIDYLKTIHFVKEKS